MKKIICTLVFGLMLANIAAAACPASCDGKCGSGECAACCSDDAVAGEVAADCTAIQSNNKSSAGVEFEEGNDSGAASAQEN